MSQPDFSNLCTPKQAAGFLHVPESRLTQWRMRKVGPEYVKIESRVLYPLEALTDFINSNTVRPTAAR